MGSIAAVAEGLQTGMFQVISPGPSRVLAVSAASVQTGPFDEGVSILRFFSTKDCWLAFGSNPTAIPEDAGSMFMPGGVVEYFEINSNEKLAVIRNSDDGKLYITEGSTR